MIGTDKRLRKVCRNYHLVENYMQARFDKENNWDLHHRREIDEMKSKQQLKDDGRYYDVAPEELIFLTSSEHIMLHHKGKIVSEDTKKRISEAKKGKIVSEDTKKRMSEAAKNRAPMPEESRKKMSETKKSKELHWWNNGKTSIMSKDCPGEGFVRGKIKLS